MSNEFPLSRNQAGLWWDWQTAPSHAIYNTASLVRIESSVDEGALRRSFQAIVDRHGCFRSTIARASDGAIVQHRHDAWEAPFVLHDARGATDAELTQSLRRQHEARVDLTRQSSVELHLFRRAPTDAVMLLRFHHLFHDHGSTDLLHAELFEGYAAEVAAKAIARPALPFEYDAFVAKERAFLASPALDTSLAYWRDALDGATAELEIPCDRGESTAPRAGATYSGPLAGAEALRAFTSTERVSPYRVLLAAYVALLHRWSGATDITVGTPADCRGTDFAGMAGYFVNLLPFRFRFDPRASFASLVRHVDEVVRTSLRHRLVPFAVLVENFWRGQSRPVSPFCRTTFALTRVDRCPRLDRPQMSAHLPWRAEIGGLVLRDPPPVPQQEGHFDLSLWTWDLGAQGLAIEVKYDPTRHSSRGAVRIAEQYERLLGALLARPDLPIGAHRYVEGEEREAISRALRRNASAPPPFEAAGDAFARAAATCPARIAIAFDGAELTYGEVDRWSNCLAATLQERGVVPGAIVAVLLPKSPPAIIAALAVLRAGGAFLPLDPSYPADRIRLMLADASPALVITDDTGRAFGLDQDRVVLFPTTPGAATPRPTPVGPTTPAYVIYTSGSTGRPKGVVVSHRGVANLARALVADWDLRGGMRGDGPSDRVFVFAPLSFDACIADVFPTFLAGATLHLGERPFPTGGRHLHDFLARAGITHVTLPPSVWLGIVCGASREGDGVPDASTVLPALRVAVSAGEPCPPEVVRRWGQSRVFYNNYGPTEITVCASTKRCSPGETPTIGSPISGCDVRIVDAALDDVPIGVLGELCLGGEGVALGYLGQASLTSERFVAAPDGVRVYRTGDLARLLASGDVEYVGRRDEQVKIRGFRIELAEIESALLRCPGIVNAAAAVRKVGASDVLVAYVVGDVAATEGILPRLGRELPRHMLPSLVVPVTEIPRSPSGKIDRTRLPAPLSEARATNTEERPATDTERSVHHAFVAVLGHARFGVEDSFFSVGGDSLSAVRVVHDVERALDATLAPDVLVRFPSVRSLASYVASSGRDDGLVVELGGRADVPETVVVVHPAGGDVSVYRELAARLAPARVLALRPPSIVRGVEDESVEDLASTYVAELRRCGLADIILVGWSLGGVIAHAMSRRMTDVLRTLVLLDSSPNFPAQVKAGAVARPDILARHEVLYREHVVSPSNASTIVCWAEARPRSAGGARGAWSSLARVEAEVVLRTTHDDLLKPPFVDEVVSLIVASARLRA